MSKYSILVMILFFAVLSCGKRDFTTIDCDKPMKIQVYSIGYPDLFFQIAMTEKHVRENYYGVIVENANSIFDSVKELKPLNDEVELISVMGLFDFLCGERLVLTLMYDSSNFFIDGVPYPAPKELVLSLFEPHHPLRPN